MGDLDSSDNCIQVVKQCYDSDGEKISTPCKDCTIDKCDKPDCPPDVEDCDIHVIAGKTTYYGSITVLLLP